MAKKRKRKSRAKPKKTGPKGPIKWNENVLERLRQAFAIGCSVTEACLYAEIDVKTFYNHCPVNSETFQSLKALRDKPLLKARQTVYNSLGQPDTARWYLEKKAREEFGSKLQIDGKILTGEMDEEDKKRVLEISEALGEDDGEE